MTKRGRKLGPALATVLVAGNMIGSGVYLLPVSLAAFGSVSILGWIGGLLAALVFAGVFAWIGVLRPETLGLPQTVEEAYGPVAGFATGALYWVQGVVGNIAIALAVTGYVEALIPALRGVFATTACTLVVSWLLIGLNLLGPRLVSRFEGLTLIVGLAPVLLVGTVGWFFFDPHVFAASWNVTGKPTIVILPKIIVPVLWAFIGLECACVASPLVENPRRNVPIATFAGVTVAAFVYIAACTAIMGVLPAAAVAHSTAPFVDVVGHILGASFGIVIALCAALKSGGALGGWILLTAEAGRQSIALSGRVQADIRRAERTQLLVCGAVMSGLIVVTASPSIGAQFSTVIDATVLVTVSVYVLAGAALARLGRTSWRLVWLGAAAVILGLVIILTQDLPSILTTAGVVALCLIAYPLLRRRPAAATAPAG
jgi:arginine:agmatine antiporter